MTSYWLAALVMAATVKVPSRVAQGEVLRIEALGAGAGWTAEALGRTIKLFPQADGTGSVGLWPVAALDKPGPVSLVLKDENGRVAHETTVLITDAHFRIRNLSPTKTMSSLKPTPGEIETTAKLVATVSDQRHWVEPLLAPTAACIISPFGVQTWYNGKPSGTYHRGIDLYSGAGTPVKASADGIVRIAQMWNMQGGMIGIDHGHGLISTYLHLSKLIANEGQFVHRGDLVGLVGSTGFSTGPHLHWGLAVNGVPVNGASWIKSMRPCGTAAAPAQKKKSPVARRKTNG